MLMEGLVPRNQSSKGVLMEVFVSEDGVVRKVSLKAARKSQGQIKEYKKTKFKQLEITGITVLDRQGTKLSSVMKAVESRTQLERTATFACKIRMI